jgi:hypothetical protein
VVSALSSRLSSSLRRARPGGSEHSRPSPARAMPMRAARLGTGRRQPTGSKPAWPPDGRRVLGHSLRSRPTWCRVRMPIGAEAPRATALTVWGRRFAHAGPSSAGGRTVATSVQRCVHGPLKRGGRPSGAGGGISGATRLSTLSPACSPPSGVDGCTPRGRTTTQPCLRPSGGLDRILVQWAMRKDKKLKGHQRRATHGLGRMAQRQPRLCVHGQMGVRPAAGREEPDEPRGSRPDL